AEGSRRGAPSTGPSTVPRRAALGHPLVHHTRLVLVGAASSHETSPAHAARLSERSNSSSPCWHLRSTFPGRCGSSARCTTTSSERSHVSLGRGERLVVRHQSSRPTPYCAIPASGSPCPCSGRKPHAKLPTRPASAASRRR